MTQIVESICQARHPGPGSGCQGCDPAVRIPENGEVIFLCALCIRWMQLTFDGQPRDVRQIAARRAELAKSDTVTEPVAA